MPDRVRGSICAVGVLSLLAVGLVTVAGPTVSPAVGGPPSSTIGTDYREDPYLSGDQKKTLDQLARRSSQPLRAESWPHGRTVGRMDLSVPSGLDGSASLSDHALAFVARYPGLWRLASTGQVRVTGLVADKDCSTVTLSLAVGGLSVVNAVLTVVVTPSGVIRGVAGHLTGEPGGEVADRRRSAEEAAEILRKHVAARGNDAAGSAGLPRPTEAVVDPFYLTDAGHAPAYAWVFDPAGGEGPTGGTGVTGGTSGLHVVSQQTGTVVVGGPGINRPDMQVAGCPDVNPVGWLPEIVLDPMTRTPAYIGLTHMGIQTSGTTPTAQAYDLLERPFMVGFYGDRKPRLHLRDAEEIPGVDGRVNVRFRQYYAGVPVEGGRLTVTLLPNGRADTIIGRFVYFPHPRLEGAMTEAAALAGALPHYRGVVCGTDAACLSEVAAENAAQPPTAERVVLSAELFVGTALGPGEERLAYRIEYARRVLYWDARAGGEIFAYSTVDSAIPHVVSNDELNNQVEIVNGVPSTGITPHRDATRTASALASIDTTLTAMGRNGFDGMGGSVNVRVRDREVNNAFWCGVLAVSVSSICRGARMVIGANMFANDAVGHELTHGIAEATAGFCCGGEPDALDENYADVLGNVFFPDTVPTEWKVGEESIYGAVRDMAHPATFNDPGHFSMLRTFCNNPAICSHSWAAVPNRAAVLIADGGVTGSTHPGIGRETLGQLYLNTLTMGLLGPSDLFLQQRLATVATCRAMVGRPATFGRVVAPSDCDHVGRAFDTVGIVAVTETGWVRFGTGINGATFVVESRSGMFLQNGCTMANQILRGLDDSGDTRVSDVADGLEIDNSGEWGAKVTSRGAALVPTRRDVTYEVWSSWFHSGMVDVDEVFNRPAGVTDDGCVNVFGNMPVQQFFSTPLVSHRSVFLNGDKGNDRINRGVSMPSACLLANVRGLRLENGQPVGAPAVWQHVSGQYGYDVLGSPANTSSLDVEVHWWFNSTSEIVVRLVYDVVAPAGTNCLVAGLQMTP